MQKLQNLFLCAPLILAQTILLTPQVPFIIQGHIYFNSIRSTKGSDSKTVYCNKILFAPKMDGKAKRKMSSKIHKFAIAFPVKVLGKKSANICQNHDHDISSCLHKHHCKITGMKE